MVIGFVVVTEEPSWKDQRQHVAVLHKMLDVLECLSSGMPWTVSAICQQTGLSKQAVYRIIRTLESRQYVVRSEADHGYLLGPSFHIFPTVLRATNDIVQAARPELESLHAQFGETVNLGILVKSEIVYLDVLGSDYGLRTFTPVGSRDFAHSTSLGKAILAALPEREALRIVQSAGMPVRTDRTLTTQESLLKDLVLAREHGYAMDDEENEVGSRCIAAIIADGSGHPIAAMSLSGPSHRLGDDRLDEIGSAVKLACAKVAAAL